MMNRNDRIAKRIVADLFGSDFATGRDLYMNEIGDKVVFCFKWQNNYCERYIVENGVPILHDFSNGLNNSNYRNSIDDILRLFKSKNPNHENCLLYDYLVAYDKQRKEFLKNDSKQEEIRKEYETNPEDARDTYEYNTFDKYMELYWPNINNILYSPRAKKTVFNKIFKMFLNGDDIRSLYDVKCGAISYDTTPVSIDDVANIRIEVLQARHHPVKEDKLNEIFGLNGAIKEMEHGFDVGYLKQSVNQDWYENSFKPALAIADKKLSSCGYSSLKGIRIRLGNETERVGMRYLVSTDEIEICNAYYSNIKDKNVLMEMLIHELGHRLQHKFASNNQKEEMKRAFESKRTRFSALKKGDAIVLENGKAYVVNSINTNSISLVSGQNTIEAEDIALLKKVKSINGESFLYEADGIPSSYALFNEEEFFAECFRAWVLGKFNGDVKKFFDGVFEK